MRRDELVPRTRPKRQRTITVTIKDRGTTAALIATLRVKRRSVEIRSGLLLTAGMSDAASSQACDRLLPRCVRLGFLLQERWFGGTA